MSDPIDLYVDTETFCETPLAHGTHRYAESAEVMILAWAQDDPLFGELPPVVEDLTDEDGVGDWSRRSREFDEALEQTRRTGGKVIMHNSGFDRTVIRHHGTVIRADEIIDTMVQAMAHGLPGGLAMLSAIFKLGDDAKHSGGKDLIHLFCKPGPKNRKLRRATKNSHPEEWDTFLRYAGSDITSMRALRHKLPSWNYPGKAGGNQLTEYDNWVLDQRVNDRGFKVDLDLADAAIEMMARIKADNDEFVEETTNGDVRSANQVQEMLAHLLGYYGVYLPDMQKGTIERRIEDPNLPEIVKDLLRARLDTAVASVSKYKALKRSVSSDGRLRGTIQFCGAVRTMRDAGRIFQPQNLVRPNKAEAKAVDGWIEIIKGGAADLILPNAPRAAAVALRGSIVADEGKKLVVADLSNIEGRALAWLAGEKWKLQAFRDYDTIIGYTPEGKPIRKGHDLYVLLAARILRKAPDDVTEDERQMFGKVPELACLGSQTLVLTPRGPVAIVDVRLSDKVWDGEQWVTHSGLVYKGTRPVMTLFGVEMTPDHKVLAGETWHEAQTVASCPSTRAQASATGMASKLSSGTTSALEGGFAPSSCVAAAGEKATCTLAHSGEEPAPVAMSAPKRRQAHGVKTGFGTQQCALMMRTVVGCVTASQRASTAATTPTTKGTPTTVGEASMSSLLGGTIERLFWRISYHSKAGTSRLWNWIVATTTEGMSRVTCASSASGQTATTCVPSANYSNGSLPSKPVYDLANAGPLNRFTILTDEGALVVHNCGFQGADGAFGTMAALYGMNLAPEQIKEIVRDWREANPAIKQFWYDMDEAAREATLSPGRTTYAGRISFNRWREWLRMVLPSGTVLCYCQPALVPHPKFEGRQSLSYLGINSYTRKWERIHTYGGKLAENATQKAARDVLKTNSHGIENAGYEILLPCHDEIVSEVDMASTQHNPEGLCALLAATPWWADEHLPLAAAGFETVRYKKA
jgi:hypothetical protein